MLLPDSFIEEVKFRNDITDVVSSYVTLKRRGRNFVGICPFHSEKTASFNVYPENGSFYCFGCGVGGDVITFIEKIENLDYIESLKFLSARASIQMPENDKKSEELSNLKRRIYEANRESARYFHRSLYSKAGKEALSYLYNRGLNDNTIKRFGLGYSPKSKYELINHLITLGFNQSEIINANLAYASYNKISSRFFDRIMFPIIDLRGNVIAFGGRIMSDQKPKYLNTSDTLVFKKSSNLFALNFAKNDESDTLILVEGYMDVIALNQAGFKNVIATLGTALTSEQAKLISRYSKEVVICYDSDIAGQKAASRAISLLRETGLLIKVLAVPNGKDPDEFIRSYGDEGKIRFKKLIENSANDVEYRLQKASKGFDLSSSDGKIGYLKEATKILATIDSKIEQEVYASKISDIIGVAKTSIMEQIIKEYRRQRNNNEKKYIKKINQDISSRNDSINKEKMNNLRAAIAEEAIIAYIINNQDLANNIFSKLPCENLCTSFNKKIYKMLMLRNQEGKSISLTALTQDLSSDEISSIAKMLAKESQRNSTKADADEYIKVIIEEKEKLNVSLLEEEKIRDYMKKLKESKN